MIFLPSLLHHYYEMVAPLLPNGCTTTTKWLHQWCITSLANVIVQDEKEVSLYNISLDSENSNQIGRLKAGFHLCECGRANRAAVRRQSREPVARLYDQGPEHAY